MRILVQLDANNVFIGFTNTDESPLEPGVELYPAGAIDAPSPLPITEGHYALWTGEHWQEVPYPVEEEAPPVRITSFAYRADFCDGLAELGLLTDEQAINAAKGDWPELEALTSFLQFLTPAQIRRVRIEWATCVTIEREHWAVLMMVIAEVVTEAQADLLCGVALREVSE